MINDNAWAKHLISCLLKMWHPGWMFHNFALHDMLIGTCKFNTHQKVLLNDLDTLVEMNPDKISGESKFLLEVDYNNLLTAGQEKQAYWVRALQVVQRAGQ
jgi:hypothetical protein